MEEQSSDKFELFKSVGNDGSTHSLLKVPKTLPKQLQSDFTKINDDVLNIFMGDVSGSMCAAFPHVVNGWQEYVKNKLIGGRTKIFVFGSCVTFIRESTELLQSDNLGGGTDLTSAFRTVREEVTQCPEHHIRVFIVTDGQHGGGGQEPHTQIELMSSPPGKTIDVFVLGIGYHFPVNYSIDIRSMLHSGAASIPSLFWAKSELEIMDEMKSIGNELGSGLAKLTLNHSGYSLPGGEKSNRVHFGEWIYFPQDPKQLSKLLVTVNEEESRLLEIDVRTITLPLLMEKVFRQWNAVMIQRYRQKLPVSMEIFDLMDTLFKKLINEAKGEIGEDTSVKIRLARKHITTYQTEYATLVKESKNLIGIEGKYMSEIELAEGILRTTVTNRKYDLKNLKMKGHGNEEFAEDVQKFKMIYIKHKDAILQLPAPVPDECCRITMSSTLQDLQDPDFMSMFDENKFEFLKTFTMTGIPVYSPIQDSSQINPWAMAIKHILVTPFTILSQRSIEGYVDMGGDKLGAEDKDVILQESDESTRFNVVIPTIPAHSAKILKPIVRTNIYALLTTFCILKNPHILDHNAHIAALSCAWVRSVADYPIQNRPEFIKERLANLAATASLYMDRAGITRYIRVLASTPKQALMTESTEKFDDVAIKCEALTKPMFFAFMAKEQFSGEQNEGLLKLMLGEFIGRCLTNYKVNDNDAKPFTDFFAAVLNNEEVKKRWIDKYTKEAVDNFKSKHGNLLKSFFSLDDLNIAIKTHVISATKDLVQKLKEQIKLDVNIKKIEKLMNHGSCGDVKWASFKAWAQEMGIPDDKIAAAMDKKQVFVYVTEALLVRSSRERLAKEPQSYELCEEIVSKKVSVENGSSMKEEIAAEILKTSEEEWRNLYRQAHAPLVMPMTPQEIITQANQRGIEVTEATFSQVYKRYNKNLKLLRNSCQIPLCPHYLKPKRNFNQHIYIERQKDNFPHALHLVSYELSNREVNAVLSEVSTCSHAGRQDRPKPQTIEPSALDYLCPQIEKLMTEYKRNKTTG